MVPEVRHSLVHFLDCLLAVALRAFLPSASVGTTRAHANVVASRSTNPATPRALGAVLPRGFTAVRANHLACPLSAFALFGHVSRGRARRRCGPRSRKSLVSFKPLLLFRSASSCGLQRRLAPLDHAPTLPRATCERYASSQARELGDGPNARRKSALPECSPDSTLCAIAEPQISGHCTGDMRTFIAVTLLAAVACGPTGLGRTVVAGVELVPAEAALRASCSRAAALLGFAVPCPGLLIAHRAAVGEGCPDQHVTHPDCLEDESAQDPPLPAPLAAFTYVQNDVVLDGAYHLYVVGVRETSRLAPYRTGCIGPEVTQAGPELSGTTSTWVECPDGTAMNSGHVLLRWSRDAVVYAVSLHGHNTVNRSVELAIARNIAYIAPGQ